MRLGFLGLAAMEDSDERLPLAVIGALVDDRLHLAIAFVDRAWPGIGDDKAEPVEGDVAKMAALDPRDLKAATVAVRRIELELARAIAVAVQLPKETASRRQLIGPSGLFPC